MLTLCDLQGPCPQEIYRLGQGVRPHIMKTPSWGCKQNVCQGRETQGARGHENSSTEELAPGKVSWPRRADETNRSPGAQRPACAEKWDGGRVPRKQALPGAQGMAVGTARKVGWPDIGRHLPGAAVPPQPSSEGRILLGSPGLVLFKHQAIN